MIVAFYVRRIQKNKMTVNEVPAKYRDAVTEALNTEV